MITMILPFLIVIKPPKFCDHKNVGMKHGSLCSQHCKVFPEMLGFTKKVGIKHGSLCIPHCKCFPKCWGSQKMLGSGIVCPACKMIICRILAFLSEKCLTYTTNCVSIVVMRIIIGLVQCWIKLFLLKSLNGRLTISVFKKDGPKLLIEFTFLVLSTK